MDQEIDVVHDAQGVAFIGDAATIDAFLQTNGLVSHDLRLDRLSTSTALAAGATQVVAEVAGHSGRWVKLTSESAKALQQFPPMTGSSAHVGRAVLTQNGKIKTILEFSTKSGGMLTNPAMLAGVAGVMSQLAIQQQMSEITDYLEKIDAKLDVILQNQQDVVFAELIGVGILIDDAMAVREHVGHISDSTWSKVQSGSHALAAIEGSALKKLSRSAEKLENPPKTSEMKELIAEASTEIRDSLAILARCMQLQDALAVIELDRVLHTEPELLDQHRRGLAVTRQNRFERTQAAISQVQERIAQVGEAANAKVLLHPLHAPRAVAFSNQARADVDRFQRALGIDGEVRAIEARRWVDAVSDVRDSAIDTGAAGKDMAVRVSSTTWARGKSATEKVSENVAQRIRRARETDDRE